VCYRTEFGRASALVSAVEHAGVVPVQVVFGDGLVSFLFERPSCAATAGQAAAALGLEHAETGSVTLPPLSDREGELLDLLAKGFQMKQVPLVMGIRAATAREYWRRIQRKWRAQTLSQAVALYAGQRPQSWTVRTSEEIR